MTNCLAVQPKVQFNIRSRKNLLQKKKKDKWQFEDEDVGCLLLVREEIMEKMNTKTKHCVLAVSGRLGTENSSRYLLHCFLLGINKKVNT